MVHSCWYTLKGTYLSLLIIGKSDSFVLTFSKSPSSPTSIATKIQTRITMVATRPLTDQDQEDIWKMLRYAAHEESVQSTKKNKVLDPYGADFGQRPGDNGRGAIVDGRIVGAAWSRYMSDGFAFLTDDLPELALAVHPDHQGQGIGQQLLKELFDDIKEISRGMVLSCRLENEPAMKVYNKMGFIQIPGSEIKNKAGSESANFVRYWKADEESWIRYAEKKDVDMVLQLIQEKAQFDHEIGAFQGKLNATQDRLVESLFGQRPKAQILLAFGQGQPVGFALYYFRYSSFQGRPSLWLDDLLVRPGHRNRGTGAALCQTLKKIAQKNQCTHLGWTVDARNMDGLRFYERLGAKRTTAQPLRGSSLEFRWEIES